MKYNNRLYIAYYIILGDKNKSQIYLSKNIIKITSYLKQIKIKIDRLQLYISSKVNKILN